MQVVDSHTHFIPLELVELFRAEGGPPDLRLVETDGEDPMFVHEGGLAYAVSPEFHDLATKLKQMDRDGIDVAVVSLAASLLLYWSDRRWAARVHKAVNDAGATLAAHSGGRVHALATVPLNDPPEAARELRRAHRELGLPGVIIGTRVGDVMLDDPCLAPFFAVADELRTPILIHPYVSMISRPDVTTAGYHLANVVGNPTETYAAAARLIMGGVLDRYPNLRFHLVHGGGSFPYQLGRLQHAYGAAEPARATVEREPKAYLERFFFDTVVYEPKALDFLLALAGPDHVLFGTDIPYEMTDLSGLQIVERIEPALAAQVLGGNALQLYGIEGAAGTATARIDAEVDGD